MTNVLIKFCFLQCTYSFFVYDWDGTNTVNDDFLGVTHLNLQKVCCPSLILAVIVYVINYR